MLHTLETIFGTAIAERPYSFPKGTIGLIRHGYSVSELIWDDRRCLLVTPKEETPSLVSIKKQVKGKFSFPFGEAILKRRSEICKCQGLFSLVR